MTATEGRIEPPPPEAYGTPALVAQRPEPAEASVGARLVVGAMTLASQSLERYVAQRLLGVPPGRELLRAIDELLEDPAYTHPLHDLVQLMPAATVGLTPEAFERIFRGAGPDNRAKIEEGIFRTGQIVEATLQMAFLNGVRLRARVLPPPPLDLAKEPCWYLDRPGIPAVARRALLASARGNTALLAVAYAAEWPGVGADIRAALVDLWLHGQRGLAAVLGSTPGVDVGLRPEERVDLATAQLHAVEAEVGYQRRLSEARAAGGPFYPPSVPSED